MRGGSDEIVSGTGRTVTTSDSLLNTTPYNMQAWCDLHYSATQTVFLDLTSLLSLTELTGQEVLRWHH